MCKVGWFGVCIFLWLCVRVACGLCECLFSIHPAAYFLSVISLAAPSPPLLEVSMANRREPIERV